MAPPTASTTSTPSTATAKHLDPMGHLDEGVLQKAIECSALQHPQERFDLMHACKFSGHFSKFARIESDPNEDMEFGSLHNTANNN